MCVAGYAGARVGAELSGVGSGTAPPLLVGQLYEALKTVSGRFF